MKLVAKFVNAYRTRQHWDKILLFLFTLFVYIHNLSPGVFGTDSGDFLTASLAKGVPHPSGYPLYTLLGILFQSLPIVATPAWKMGLVSAIISSLSVVVVYLIAKILTKSRYISLASSLTLAFLYPFWLYAEVVEVFSLHYFFILLLSYIAIRFYKTKEKRNLYYLAFFLGVSLTNNLAIILLFPAILILIFISYPKVLLDYKLLLKSFLFLVLGLTPYVYIPIAASYDPVVNWGKVVNLENFLDLILRKQYGWGKFNPGNSLNHYILYWRTFINPIIPILSLLGGFYLIKKRQYGLFLFLLLSFLALGPLYFKYTVREFVSSIGKFGSLERFYIQSIVSAMLFVPAGLLAFQELIQKLLKNKVLRKFTRTIFVVTIFTIPLASFITNFENTNLSHNFIGDNLGYDILNTLPENSILLSQDDHNVFNALYIQLAYDIRPDIYIPGRHDSLIGIATASGMNEQEAEKYTIENGGAIENEVFLNALPNMLRQRDVFSDFILSEVQVFDNELGKVIYVPYGLVYKLYFESKYKLTKEEYLSEIEMISSLFSTKAFKENESTLGENINYSVIKRKYALAYYNIAGFLAKYYNDTETAKAYLQKGLELDPLAKPTN